MTSNLKNAFLAALTASLLFCFAPTTFATIAPITAGQNGTGGGEHLQIPWTTEGGNVGEWLVGDPNHPIELIADPTAPPMEKWFFTPTGGQLEIGWSAPVGEFFLVWPGGEPSFPNPSPAITDWHEHIHEPGWEWIVPPQSAMEFVITRDGQAWPWAFIDPPAGTDPNPAWFWVKFPPIGPGHVLDIHKELVWVGTDNNSVWGDGMLDDGVTFIDESKIRVWEYPTIPEPSTLLLGTLAAVGIIGARRRRK